MHYSAISNGKFIFYCNYSTAILLGMSLAPDNLGFTRPDMDMLCSSQPDLQRSGSIPGNSRTTIAASPVLTRSSQITVTEPPVTHQNPVSSLQLALSRPPTNGAVMETSEHINAFARKVEDVHGEASQDRSGKRNKNNQEREQGSEMVQFVGEQREQGSSSDYLLQDDPELWQEVSEEDF